MNDQVKIKFEELIELCSQTGEKCLQATLLSVIGARISGDEKIMMEAVCKFSQDVLVPKLLERMRIPIKTKPEDIN